MSTRNENERAPDFELPDQHGRPVRLSEHLAKSPVLLAFFRGHWCPYCRRYLCKLQANAERIRDRGVCILAISPEPAATSLKLARELSLSFPVLCDCSGKVIDSFGTRNGFSNARALLPHPSVFLIDQGGAIRFHSIDRNYKRRTTIRTILHELDSMLSTQPA